MVSKASCIGDAIVEHEHIVVDTAVAIAAADDTAAVVVAIVAADVAEHHIAN